MFSPSIIYGEKEKSNVFRIMQKLKQRNTPKATSFGVFQEAQTGFEPVDTGVADHCLTTWLLRRILLLYITYTDQSTRLNASLMTPGGIEPPLPP